MAIMLETRLSKNPNSILPSQGEKSYAVASRVVQNTPGMEVVRPFFSDKGLEGDAAFRIELEELGGNREYSLEIRTFTMQDGDKAFNLSVRLPKGRSFGLTGSFVPGREKKFITGSITTNSREDAANALWLNELRNTRLKEVVPLEVMPTTCNSKEEKSYGFRKLELSGKESSLDHLRDGEADKNTVKHGGKVFAIKGDEFFVPKSPLLKKEMEEEFNGIGLA